MAQSPVRIDLSLGNSQEQASSAARQIWDSKPFKQPPGSRAGFAGSRSEVRRERTKNMGATGSVDPRDEPVSVQMRRHNGRPLRPSLHDLIGIEPSSESDGQQDLNVTLMLGELLVSEYRSVSPSRLPGFRPRLDVLLGRPPKISGGPP